jgi:hypothetical protein
MEGVIQFFNWDNGEDKAALSRYPEQHIIQKNNALYRALFLVKQRASVMT